MYVYVYVAAEHLLGLNWYYDDCVIEQNQYIDRVTITTKLRGEERSLPRIKASELILDAAHTAKVFCKDRGYCPSLKSIEVIEKRGCQKSMTPNSPLKFLSSSKV